MKQLERRAAAYCRAVAKKLPIGGSRKKAYLQNLRTDVDAYLSNHPWAEPRELRSVFGEPEQIAVSFVSEMSYEEINAKFRARNRALRLVSAAVVLALLMLVGMIVYLILRNKQDMEGYFVVTEARYLWRWRL